MFIAKIKPVAAVIIGAAVLLTSMPLFGQDGPLKRPLRVDPSRSQWRSRHPVQSDSCQLWQTQGTPGRRRPSLLEKDGCEITAELYSNIQSSLRIRAIDEWHLDFQEAGVDHQFG